MRPSTSSIALNELDRTVWVTRASSSSVECAPLILAERIQRVAHVFKLNSESLKRNFAVYVVIARTTGDTKLYVGKTGDNREGCNPVISRCGNHFSYNKIHSQVRNKIPDHEHREYVYVFDHFDEYCMDNAKRRYAIDRINEMERWLNLRIQGEIAHMRGVALLNPYGGGGRRSAVEHAKREQFRTAEAEKKLASIIDGVKAEVFGLGK